MLAAQDATQAAALLEAAGGDAALAEELFLDGAFLPPPAPQPPLPPPTAADGCWRHVTDGLDPGETFSEGRRKSHPQKRTGQTRRRADQRGANPTRPCCAFDTGLELQETSAQNCNNDCNFEREVAERGTPCCGVPWCVHSLFRTLPFPIP